MINIITLKSNLENKGYSVSVFDSKEDASHYLESQLYNKTIGFGGSVTLSEMNLYNILSKNNTVLWHDHKPEHMTIAETRLKAAQADVYISSVNGISMNGEIVNIDNTGNRVAALSYGPSIVYLIIGVNKIAENLESALYRARNIAAPLNAKRLNRKTPCAIKADHCYDCNSEDRICRNLSILLTKPTGLEYEIILINENLGY